MCFELIRRWLLLGLTALALLGCRISVKDPESAPDAQLKSMGGVRLGCLTGTGPVILKYFKGGADPAEVADKWNCGIEALQLFSDRAVGKNPGVYTPEELRRFLQRYFVTGVEISKGLVNEFMELKVAILGGKRDRLSRDDLRQVRKVLEILRDQSLELLPYMPLTPESLREASDEKIDEVLGRLDSVGSALTRVLLEGSLQSYSFDHLEALLTELASVYPGIAPQKLLERMPLIVSLKRVLISPDRIRNPDGTTTNGLSGRELIRAIDVLRHTYGLMIRASQASARAALPGASRFEGEGRVRTYRLLDEALSLVGDSVAQYPSSVIPYEEFETLIENLKDSDLGTIRKSSVRALVRPMIDRVFMVNPGRLVSQARTGLDSTGIDRVRGLLRDWHEGQIWLEALKDRLQFSRNAQLEALPGFPGMLFDPAYPAERWLEVGRSVVRRPSVDLMRISVKAAQELRGFIADIPALLQANGDSQIVFLPVSAERGHTLSGLSQINWLRILSRIVLEGYSLDANRALSLAGISVSEFKNLVEDFTPLLADLKVVDESQKTLYLRRFRELSLFTFESDGDAIAGRREAMLYFAEIMSASKLAKRIYAKLEGPCYLQLSSADRPTDPSMPEFDVYGRRWLKESCARNEVFKDFDLWLTHMPAMKKYYASLVHHDSARDEFQVALIQAARQNTLPEGWFNSYLSEGIASVLQFVEVLFARFDVDSDGYIDEREAKAAGPVFLPTLQELVKRDQRLVLNGLLTFLLANGVAPETDECGRLTVRGGADFAGWLMRRNPKFRTDRTIMLKIFGEIVRLTAEKPKSCTEPDESRR